MRRLSHEIVLTAALLLVACAAKAQLFSDGGLGCGSGIVFMPTCVTSPASEFRVQATHALSPGSALRGGYSVADLTGGLSSNLECYVRIGIIDPASEEPSTPYGFGAKYLLPFRLPLVSNAALWIESATNVQDRRTTISFIPGTRYALLLNAGMETIAPSVMLGATSIAGRMKPLLGAGATMRFGNSLQAGVEGIFGYQGVNDIGVFATATYQLLGHVGIKGSAGQTRVNGVSSHLLSVGLQLMSGRSGFAPEEKKKPEGTIPSFDEINAELSGDTATAGDGARTIPVDPSGPPVAPPNPEAPDTTVTPLKENSASDTPETPKDNGEAAQRETPSVPAEGAGTVPPPDSKKE